MGTVSLPGVDANATLAQLREIVAETNQVMEWLSNGQIDFKNVRARSIIADRLKANTITANEIAVNTITADRMNVSELSAIAADLGHITAGLIEAVQIFGSYIATADGTYPRVEISSSDNLFAAYLNSGDSLQIVPLYTNGAPAIILNIGSSMRGNISLTSSSFSMVTAGTTDINIQSARDVILNPSSNLKIGGSNGWSGTFDVVADVNFGSETVDYTRVTVTKGIITNVSAV